MSDKAVVSPHRRLLARRGSDKQRKGAKTKTKKKKKKKSGAPFSESGLAGVEVATTGARQPQRRPRALVCLTGPLDDGAELRRKAELLLLPLARQRWEVSVGLALTTAAATATTTLRRTTTTTTDVGVGASARQSFYLLCASTRGP